MNRGERGGPLDGYLYSWKLVVSKYVSQQLGHTNPTTTLRYYARWIPTGDRRYVDVLDTAAEKTWNQQLAPEAMDDQKPLISGVVHYRRPMMMNQQPLIPDALEEIRG